MTNLNTNQDLSIVLNKIEALVLDQNFINSTIEVVKNNGCSAAEWNQNKVAILYKLAMQIVLNN